MLNEDIKKELQKPLSGVSSCTAVTKVTDSCIQLVPKDVALVRSALQPKVCPICGKSTEKFALDHCHTTGLIRDVLCMHCNSFLGRIENNAARHLIKKSNLSNVLINLSKVLTKEHYRLIHPTEKPKEPKFSKLLFNKIAKWYKVQYPNKKALVYPKSGKLTKSLQVIYEEYNKQENK